MRDSQLYMVLIPTQTQDEADAFLKRIAACKDAQEVSAVVAEVKALYETPAQGGGK